MKYMRKTPVEAIQWKGDNQIEVADFLYKATCAYATNDDGLDNLIIAYTNLKGRNLKAIVPKFGWVVIDGKTLQSYKDSTFHKTFEKIPDCNKGIDWEGMDKTIEEAFDSFDEVFKGFKDVFGAEPNKETSDVNRMRVQIDPDGRLTKLIDDIDKGIREEVEKQLSEGLKDMAGSDTHNATFESVLDEMKELHAKKDKDYGSAFHKSFEEFGATAGVVRLNDKMERVKSLVKNGKVEVKDESLLDSLEDLACYAVMLYVELKNKDNGKL